MSVLVRNGRVVTAVDDYRADVFIDGDTVTLIGRDLAPPADRLIDATGRLVLPGGVDPPNAAARVPVSKVSDDSGPPTDKEYNVRRGFEGRGALRQLDDAPAQPRRPAAARTRRLTPGRRPAGGRLA